MIQRPPSLKKGNLIAVISPAGFVEEAHIASTLKLIKKKGYIPVLGKYTLGKHYEGYNYSGTEGERIKDINWAFSDDAIKAIWTTRGGYGCQHLLDHIDFKKFKKNPKWYIGYSDNTAIQSLLLKNNFESINGQTLKTSSFGVTKESYDLVFDILKGKFIKYTLEPNDFNKKGKAEGQLVGGNLALIYALLGTKYSFNFKDKILFIEEIGENFYALDRMLMSLELAGAFKAIKGLIIGGMTNMGKETDNMAYEHSYDDYAYKIIQNRIKKYNFPTLFAFPNGHIKDNRPLVIGSRVSLKVGKSVELKFL